MPTNKGAMAPGAVSNTDNTATLTITRVRTAGLVHLRCAAVGDGAPVDVRTFTAADTDFLTALSEAGFPLPLPVALPDDEVRVLDAYRAHRAAKGAHVSALIVSKNATLQEDAAAAAAHTARDAFLEAAGA